MVLQLEETDLSLGDVGTILCKIKHICVMPSNLVYNTSPHKVLKYSDLDECLLVITVYFNNNVISFSVIIIVLLLLLFHYF